MMAVFDDGVLFVIIHAYTIREKGGRVKFFVKFFSLFFRPKSCTFPLTGLGTALRELCAFVSHWAPTTYDGRGVFP